MLRTLRNASLTLRVEKHLAGARRGEKRTIDPSNNGTVLRSALLRINDQGHRAIIDQIDFHHGLKLT